MGTLAKHTARASLETRAGGDYDAPVPVTKAEFQITAPLIIGIQISILLLGVVLAVAWRCLWQRRPASKWRKLLVVVLVVLATAETALLCSRLVRWEAVYGGGIKVANNISEFPEDWLAVVVGMLAGSMCELFMVARAVRFARATRPARGKVYAALTAAMALVLSIGAAFELGMGTVLLPFVMGTAQSFLQLTSVESGFGNDFKRAILLHLGASVAMDCMITVITSLQYRKARTGFGPRTSILDALATFCIRNGLFVLVIQVAQLAANAVTTTSWGFMPYFAMSKIRILTVLAILVAPRDAHDAFYARPHTALPDMYAPDDADDVFADLSYAGSERKHALPPSTPSSGGIRELVLPTIVSPTKNSGAGAGASARRPHHGPSRSMTDLALGRELDQFPRTPPRDSPRDSPRLNVETDRRAPEDSSFPTAASAKTLVRTASEGTLGQAEKGEAMSLSDMLRGP
ncbi:hypothetical protein Q5752_004559 [Cryptotrichosporon argae]